MLRIRLCEESLIDPILDGAVCCSVYLQSGEEVAAIEIIAASAGKGPVHSRSTGLHV